MPQSNTRNYKPDEGEKLYRRSIYTFWKRTAPHPAMEILNAPTGRSSASAANAPTPAAGLRHHERPAVRRGRPPARRPAIAAAEDFDARLDFITTRLLSRTLTDDERPPCASPSTRPSPTTAPPRMPPPAHRGRRLPHPHRRPRHPRRLDPRRQPDPQPRRMPDQVRALSDFRAIPPSNRSLFPPRLQSAMARRIPP
jgi:hypothetical protein